MKKVCVGFILLALMTSLCACQAESLPVIREEDITAICELATLKSYYNNVGKYEKKKDYFWQVDREMWIEYEGVAVIGVDLTKMRVNISGTRIEITMPPAELLSIGIVEGSLNKGSYTVSTDRWWLFDNKITTEDQQEAVKKGQEEMKAAVEANDSLFAKAEARAKELIKNYIVQLGNAANVEYEIVWRTIDEE